MTAGGQFQFDAGLQQTLCTLPQEALCHYITDDELERLSEMRKEPVMEIFLASIGAFLGALIPAWQELGKFNVDPTTVSGTGLFTMGVAIAMLAVAILSGALWRQRTKSHKSMAQTIRDRPRVQVKQAQ